MARRVDGLSLIQELVREDQYDWSYYVNERITAISRLADLASDAEDA
jgi:hypothetical protein